MTKLQKEEFINYCNNVLVKNYKYFGVRDQVRCQKGRYQKIKFISFKEFREQITPILERSNAASPFVPTTKVIEIVEKVITSKTRFCQVCKKPCIEKSYFFCEQHFTNKLFQEWDYSCFLPAIG